MNQHRWSFVLFLLHLSVREIDTVGHANSTRLCRTGCHLSSLSFSSNFVLPSSCGQLASFYGCRLTINLNFTRHTFTIDFSAYEEQTFEMLQIDFDHSVDLDLNFAFFRNLFTSQVIFTCLTGDRCTDDYLSVVLKPMIDSESILYELLPIYADRSMNNRTITCLNTTNEEIPCYGGFCKSISIERESETDEKDRFWSFEDCEYPSELSVLSSSELTSLTAFFSEFQPENPNEDQLNSKRITLICNIDFCNGEETINKGKEILNRFNRPIFNFQSTSTTHSFSSFSSSTTTESLDTSSQLTSTTTQITDTSTTGGIRPWQIALIVVGVIVGILIIVIVLIVYLNCH